MPAGYKVDMDEVVSLGHAWESSASNIEGISFSGHASSLPTETEQAVSQIPHIVSDFMSKTAERIREMGTKATESAAAYEATEVAVVAEFKGLM